MVPAMLYFEVHPRVASSTSLINYQMIALTNLITLLTKNLLPIQVLFWYAGLALIGGSIITKICHIIFERYKLSYAVILIMIGLAVSNLVAGVWYVIIYSNRFGFDSLLTSQSFCK